MHFDDLECSEFSSAHALPSFLKENEETIEVMPPVEHESKLLFQVFSNGFPIAFARLKKVDHDERYQQRVVQLFSAKHCPTYCLKLIQVSQNYQNRGIGSVLLKEIIHYCKNNRIGRLTGEMHGEFPALKRWYQSHGFSVDAANQLELLIP